MKLLIETGRLDKLGVVASLACAIHCAVLPVIFTTLPLLGLEFLSNIWFEIGMLSFSLCVGAYTLLLSYPKHQKVSPIILLITGFLCIGTGHLVLKSLEFLLIPSGGLLLATAHLINIRHTKNCNHQKNNQMA